MDSSSTESSTESNLSSDSNDELNHIIHMLPKPKMYRTRANPFTYFDDFKEFKMRYRFSKQTVREMLEVFELNTLEYATKKNFPIEPINQLLLTLRFYATGSFQQVLGDHLHVDKSTVCRIIPRITAKIASKSMEFIKMPQTQEEIHKVIGQFYNIAHFPRVVGSIDCTHIRIVSPGGENAELFRNRKGWFSINTQAVCDAQLRIRDIVARWPGSTHDSTIFQSSALRAKCEAGEFLQGWLLGDSGYACKEYLLTPLLNPQTPAAERYNRAHIHTRNTVERCFGVLKKRFPCLSTGLRIKVEKAVEVIVATAVLHNFAIDMKDIVPPGDNVAEEALNEEFVIPNNVSARNALVNTVFSR